jgi:[ribosomal protein S18]-alanine N-acetyltransferase
MYAIHDSPDPGPVLIRKAQLEDAADIRQLALNSKIDAWTFDQYRDETYRSDAVFLVAHSGLVIDGFISGRIVPGVSEGSDGEIYNIAVSPEFRRKRIGHELLENAIKAFALGHCNTVWLEVRESNHQAIQFYENSGFRTVTIRRNFYTYPVENAIVMKLTLVGVP